MDADDVFARTRDNRLLAADMFAALTPEQWTTPSLCGGWTVRDLAGHYVMPLEVGFATFVKGMVRGRGSPSRATDLISRTLAQRPTDDLVATIRAKSGRRFSPPGVGPLGPFTDTCVHLRDAARPLGLPVDVSLDDWRTALEFLVSPRGRRGFVGRGVLDGLRLDATDQPWSAGAGASVTGTSEALAMAVCGRRAALADLTGDGATVLATRLGADGRAG